MDIRSSLDGLKSLFGAAPTEQAAQTAQQQTKSGAAASGSWLGSDSATLSSAGSEVSQTASDTGVRMDKVSSIQSALASGSYSVSSALVASKVVDSMLGSQS
jgi:negative regulator of flagellin synthesis FlgM